MGTPKDDARDKILARRRKFLIAALSSATVAAVACDGEPQPCLDAPPPTTGAGGNTTTSAGGGGADGGTGGVGGPQACLDFAPGGMGGDGTGGA